jgi:hypothetical protein
MNYGDDLLQLVENKEAMDGFCNLAELPLDALMEPGLMKDLPFLGTLCKLYGTVLSIRDRWFLQKIARFLRHTRQLTEHEKQEFFQSLDEKGMRQKVGEKLVILLERQDDIEKAEILAIVFESYVKRRIGSADFERLAHAITITHLPDLGCFAKRQISPLLSPQTGAALLASGLSTVEVEIKGLRLGGTQRGDVENKYYYSALGVTLNEILSAYYSPKG